MKKLLIILLITALLAGSCLMAGDRSGKKSDVRFFEPGSVYVYLMGSYTHLAPPLDFYQFLGGESDNAFGPTIGIGFRAINFGNRLFLNIEADYTYLEFDFTPFTEDQKLHLITIGANLEGRLSRSLHLYGGIGVTFHSFSSLGYTTYFGDYYDVGNDSVTTLELAFGFKIPISRNLSFRTEFRINSEVYGDFDHYDYYDDYYDDDFSDWEFVSSSFMAGIELRF